VCLHRGAEPRGAPGCRPVARATVAATGKKFAVYYSERLHVECAVHASTLIRLGAIGRVVQVLGLGPHRLNPTVRPAWFFDKKFYGGILCDIGSHQFEQFLHYTGATDATILHTATANYAHPEHANFEDFGEASVQGDNGASNYVRVDWFTPDGLGTWGDGRTVILGTNGTIELRKYLDVARQKTTDHLIIVDRHGEHHLELQGQVGFPYFGQLILDCINRTENAMTQDHAFKDAELCLKAQIAAIRLAVVAAHGAACGCSCRDDGFSRLGLGHFTRQRQHQREAHLGSNNKLTTFFLFHV
jgi:predicted dehydrogenase